MRSHGEPGEGENVPQGTAGPDESSSAKAETIRRSRKSGERTLRHCSGRVASRFGLREARTKKMHALGVLANGSAHGFRGSSLAARTVRPPLLENVDWSLKTEAPPVASRCSDRPRGEYIRAPGRRASRSKNNVSLYIYPAGEYVFWRKPLWRYQKRRYFC